MEIEKEFSLYQSKIKEIDLAPNTKNIYQINVKAFLNHFFEKESVEAITILEFQSYLELWPNNHTKHIKINSIKSFYKLTEINSIDFTSIEKPERKKEKPSRIDANLLLELIGEVDNRKHKALLSLAFSTGMWLHEILNLKLEDINFEKNLIMVRHKHASKNRVIKISDGLAKILIHYKRKFVPVEYLFNGQNQIQYNKKSAFDVVQNCIGGNCNFNMIRNTHIYFLIESGINDKEVIKHLGWGINGQKQLNIFKKYAIKIAIKILSPI